MPDGSYSFLPGSMHKLPGMALIHTGCPGITNSMAAFQRQNRVCNAAPREVARRHVGKAVSLRLWPQKPTEG